MTDRHLEQAVLVAAIVVMFGLSLWLQMNFLKPKSLRNTPIVGHEPDYSIKKFTATGRDSNGVAYVLEAQYLVHFPDDNTSELDKPKLRQYNEGELSRTTSSDHGKLLEDGTKILLQGNVRVTQGATDMAVDSVTSANRMTIKLR
ncbi:MAG: LPS export ABC transporter periplasmic protein LptC [Arenicellales bacterium]|jgi:lipopolysaccharide export system protein LptC|nr:LPS export ABC transporter periplasmic protein LptC [Gammaproteobacteria bacterium]MDP7063745.1 LPS export ABC transporter periplasmic protein LptC [Arenicellales bacterium]